MEEGTVVEAGNFWCGGGHGCEDVLLSVGLRIVAEVELSLENVNLNSWSS